MRLNLFFVNFQLIAQNLYQCIEWVISIIADDVEKMMQQVSYLLVLKPWRGFIFHLQTSPTATP